MLKDCLLAYYHARCHNLEDAFFKSTTYFDPDGVHDLRVEIKQIRAFFRLLAFIAPTFKAKKHIQHFRALFKAAGDLRDVHVQQELTRKWSQELGEFMSEYYNSLKQKEFPARETFSRFAHDFELDKEIAINRQRISHALKGLSQKELAERLQQRINLQLQKILDLGSQALQDDSRLHTLRIHCKETRYALDIVGRCLPESVYRNALNDQLRELHQALGKWHDGDVAREHILQFQQICRSNEADGDSGLIDSTMYQQLLQKMQEEKAIHLKSFHTAWIAFVALLK